PGGVPRHELILAVYAAAIWLYMDFSGYCDMAIGVSRLFGYRIVENFDRPFLKKNIALYWRSWHISVYSWIRDYFYFPLFVYRGSRPKLYAGIFLTMMVFMLWHAPTPGFLFAGIYNGIGLVVWKLFQDLKEKLPFVERILSCGAFTPFSVFLTFSYVSLGIAIAFLGGDASNIKDIFLNLSGI
ncbi:MAG: hypothetical protein GF408_05610, partial [Candidatus Omnitrophica bacterium]|nr:hypothetical protein [Candidatus Omnitrophota bacterium]